MSNGRPVQQKTSLTEDQSVCKTVSLLACQTVSLLDCKPVSH